MPCGGKPSQIVIYRRVAAFRSWLLLLVHDILLLLLRFRLFLLTNALVSQPRLLLLGVTLVYTGTGTAGTAPVPNVLVVRHRDVALLVGADPLLLLLILQVLLCHARVDHVPAGAGLDGRILHLTQGRAQLFGLCERIDQQPRGCSRCGGYDAVDGGRQALLRDGGRRATHFACEKRRNILNFMNFNKRMKDFFRFRYNDQSDNVSQCTSCLIYRCEGDL